MSLTKRDIVKNISFRTRYSNKQSRKLLDKFIDILATESKEVPLKISNFGTFFRHKTPKRVGRNPKTKEAFTIPKMTKLSLKPSKNIKDSIN